MAEDGQLLACHLAVMEQRQVPVMSRLVILTIKKYKISTMIKEIY